MRQRTIAAAAIVLLSLTGVAVNAGTASAAGWLGCNQGFSCYYDGDQGTGVLWVAPSDGCHLLGNVGMMDRITSVWNRGRQGARLDNWNSAKQKWESIDFFPPGAKRNVVDAADNKADRVCIA